MSAKSPIRTLLQTGHIPRHAEEREQRTDNDSSGWIHNNADDGGGTKDNERG
jgi:hypothetical protein